MMEGTGRQGRRRRQLLDDLKDKREYRKLKEKVLVSLCTELALEEGMEYVMMIMVMLKKKK
jgi:hypothetical protein